MTTVTVESRSLRSMLQLNRAVIGDALTRYGATNPRIFGSVARGDATASSDVDLLVDLLPDPRNPLMRVAGLGEELSGILGVNVDVVADELMREQVSAEAHADAVPL